MIEQQKERLNSIINNENDDDRWKQNSDKQREQMNRM